MITRVVNHPWTKEKASLFLKEISGLTANYKIDLEIAPYSGVSARGYSDHDLDLILANGERRNQVIDFWEDRAFWERIGLFDLIRNRRKDKDGGLHVSNKEIRGFFGELEKIGMRVLFLDWIKKVGSCVNIVLNDDRMIDFFPSPQMTEPTNKEDLLLFL